MKQIANSAVPCINPNFLQAECSAWTWFLAWLILRPRRWRRQVPSKHVLTFNGLHGVISKKMDLFVVAAVKPTNPTIKGNNLKTK
jgi:hypothetical protein